MHIISGTHKNRKIISPKGLVTRPTAAQLRGALFNICQNYIEGAHFLDLFAGSGAMGLEALSRGAKSVTFIDSNRESIRCIQKNIQNLKMENQAKVFSGDVFQLMHKLAKQGALFDIIFADPPYHEKSVLEGKMISHADHVLRLLDEGILLKENGELFIESASETSLDLTNLHHLMLVSTRRMGAAGLHQLRQQS